MSTFLQLRTRAAVRFGDASFVVVTDATWKEYINEAFRWLQAQDPRWPFLRTTGTVSVASGARTSGALATRVFQVAAVYNTTDSRPMSLLTNRARVPVAYTTTETGAPVHYRRRGNVIEVFPLPTATTTLTVEYFAPLTDLSADGDVPGLPPQYHDVLVSMALSRATRDDGNLAAAKDYETEVGELVKAMRADLVDTQDNHPHPEMADNRRGVRYPPPEQASN